MFVIIMLLSNQETEEFYCSLTNYIVFQRLMRIHHKATVIFVYLDPSQLGNEGGEVSAHQTEGKIRFYKRHRIWLIFFSACV